MASYAAKPIIDIICTFIPEQVSSVIKSVQHGPAGLGCCVLLSKVQFRKWRWRLEIPKHMEWNRRGVCR